MKNVESALKKLWKGRCSITDIVNWEDDRGITKCCKRITAENVPCRISYKTYKRDRAGESKENVNELSREVRLITDKNVSIKAGCRISVEQNGMKREFEAAGIPAVYSTHQEVMIVDREKES